MLVKESTLRRIIREEARLSLREENGNLGGITLAWPQSVEITSSFAKAFAQAAGTGGRALEFVRALKSIYAYGMKSEYASFVIAPPATVTGAPGRGAQMYGKLVCLMASMANKQAYTDYASAQTALTGKSSNNKDVVGPMILKALGGSAGESEVLGMINQIKYLASIVPPDGVPAQAAPAVDPGTGTVFSNAAGNANVAVNVKKGSLSWNFTAAQASGWLPTLMPIIKGQKVLQSGSKGADVKIVQEMIRIIQSQNGQGAASAMPGSALIPDGDYGNNTVKAVIALQKATGLAVDGKIGQQVLFQLFGRSSTITGATGDKGNYFNGAVSADGTTPAGGAGLNPNALIATRPTQSEGRIRRRY
jgi:hypothetical protein